MRSLNGEWKFWKDDLGTFTHKDLSPKQALTVQVPAPWQAHADLRDFTGIGWYQRTFSLTAKMIDGRAVILHFGAVDYLAEVWVNGKKAGMHEGGYLPFEFDVTRLVKVGNNTVTVRAADSLETFAEVPHGKQSWYGYLSGIWQDVTVESRPRKHITSLKITPQGEQAHIEVTLNQKLAARDRITVEVFAPDGTPVALAESKALTTTLRVPSPQVWDIDTPNLYTARATLNDDVVEDTFGFRTIESRDGKLWLNGRPVYMRSALDQDYYPDGIYTPPSQDYIEDQFRKAKELGLNSLRIHIKIGDPRYYKAADKIGLLIWTEMPNWQMLTDDTKRRAHDTFVGMVARDWNRPSIIIRSIINEAWGVEIMNPAHRQWMSETYDWLKALDPSRLVVDNSACHSNFHVVTDIDDMHIYYTVPDHHQKFREWTASFAKRPKWTFTPQLDGAQDTRRFLQNQWHADWIMPSPENRRRGDEPLIVSEFGNWGLPDVDLLKKHYGGQEPWWFETGLQHGEGQVYPHGIEDRFKLYHLDRAFPTLSDLSRASQRMQYVALKYELEEMRRHASIQGYVITEFTDLHWECNGLLDMARNPKAFHDIFKYVNADDVIVPHWERVAYWDGEMVKIKLGVSQYSQLDLRGSHIEWLLVGVDGASVSGRTESIAPVQADVVDAGAIEFDAPTVQTSTAAQVILKLVTPDGKVAAQNHLDLCFFPRASSHATMTAAIYSAAYADELRALGYTVVDSINDATVVVTDVLTEELHEHVRHGGRVLWLAESIESDDAKRPWLGGLNGAHIGPRDDTPWSGDWASNFNWLNQDKLFKDIPTNGTVDFAFADLTPEHVIHSVHPFHYATDVHSGLFLGWIHKVVALIAERKVGDGKLLISTYRLGQHLTTHPVAAIMLRDMVAALVG